MIRLEMGLRCAKVGLCGIFLRDCPEFRANISDILVLLKLGHRCFPGVLSVSQLLKILSYAHEGNFALKVLATKLFSSRGRAKGSKFFLKCPECEGEILFDKLNDV